MSLMPLLGWPSRGSSSWGGGFDAELEATVKHSGWLAGKLDHVGSAGLEINLPWPATQQRRSAQVIRQNAPALAPFDPPTP